MAAEASIVPDWEDRLLRWSNTALEAVVFYLLLAACARPRDGSAALLPLLTCASLALGYTVRALLDSTTVDSTLHQAATLLAGLAWGSVVIRACAPPGYWQADANRGLLILGAIFGGRDGVGLQPLGFWAAILLWWRGQVLPSWEPTLDDALSRFRLGALASGAAVGLTAVSDGAGRSSLVQLEQALGVAAFLVVALLLTGLARRREMAGGYAAAPTLEGHSRPLRAGPGLAPLLVIGVAVLALALAAWGADAISPELLAPVVGLGTTLLQAGSAALAAVFQFLAGLWPNLAVPPAPVEPTPQATTSPGNGAMRPPVLANADWLAPVLFVLVALSSLVFIWIFVQVLRFSVSSMRIGGGLSAVSGPGDDQRPSPIGPLGQISIYAVLVRLFRAMFSRSGRAREAPARGRGEPRAADSGLRSIRTAYRAYLAWAARLGCPRRADETPDEFRRRLIQSLPAAEPDADVLTRLYVAARYGAKPCSQADLRRAELALTRLRSTHQKLRTTQNSS